MAEPERELYLLYGGGTEPFSAFYNCSSCGCRFPPSWSTELRPVVTNFRDHPAAKQFADHADEEHFGIAFKEPRAGDKVRLPGIADLTYQVRQTDTENGTATLLPIPPAPTEAKREDVEWKFLVYLK
jgi:hypothetical protein